MLLRSAFTVVVPFNSYGYFRLINETINRLGGKVLVFGHIGITAGIIKGCDILTAPAKSPNSYLIQFRYCFRSRRYMFLKLSGW